MVKFLEFISTNFCYQKIEGLKREEIGLVKVKFPVFNNFLSQLISIQSALDFWSQRTRNPHFYSGFSGPLKIATQKLGPFETAISRVDCSLVLELAAASFARFLTKILY
jgi:hypothetical protein